MQKKDLDRGVLYGIMIYRMNGSYEDAAVILADSGRMQPTAEKKHLLLTLYSGEWFENMRQSNISVNANVPYRRETFSTKQILLDFDSGFNMTEMGGISADARSKGLSRIVHDLDSIREFNDSVGHQNYREAKMLTFLRPDLSNSDSTKVAKDVTGRSELFDSLYAAAGEFVRNHPDIDAEHNRLEQVARTSVGAMFTDFTIEHGNADGSAVSLSDYVGKGKFVLVDFWASWCGPCKEEMPNLKDVYERYKGDRFELVGIAVSDKRADTEAAVAKLELPWPIIYDAQSIPSEIYGVNAIPHIILFDPDGKIVARDLRGGMIGEFVGALLRSY